MPLGANKAAIMGVAGVSTAEIVLLYDTDHSGVSSAAITSGITSTYGEYIFGFYNVNPATDGAHQFQFNVSVDGGSNYKTGTDETNFVTTHFNSYHDDGTSASATALAYQTSYDRPNSKTDTILIPGIGNGADEAGVGKLHLFNPASTTYVKHFIFRSQHHQYEDRSSSDFVAGYVNTTSAVNAIIFRMSSGNFDATIKMWGVK